MIEKLKEILSEYWSGDISEIELDAVLTADLGLNSMELFDLVCTVEERFEVEIPDRMLQKFVTVRNVVEFLESATE